MKLYLNPVSMTSRPARLFIAESGIDVEQRVIDLMTGEHHQEPFISINPNRLVPLLDDGDFRLTESSAILKYLADYFGAGLLTLGEIIRCDFSAYPNIERWLGNMKQLNSWPEINEALYGFADAVKDQQFEAI